VCDASGAIIEIHAVAAPDRPAKMVVRDIETTLLAQWNLAPARNKISIAQMQPGASPDALRILRPPRLRLVAIQVAAADAGGTPAEARVVLRHGGDTADAVGVAQAAPGDAHDRSALLVRAALRAVEVGAGRPEGLLRLVDVSPVTLGARSAVVLLVALASDKGDDLLTGSALIRGNGTPADPAASDRAVVAAVLDAVNRRLFALEAPAPPAAGNAS
jgi:hypothetical protein